MTPKEEKKEEAEESEELPFPIDQKFVDRSAKVFSDSIESGEFFKELKGEDTMS